MTVDELSRYYYLDKDVQSCEDRLKELRSLAYGAPCGAGNGTQGGTAESRVERYAIRIQETEERLQERIRARNAERVRLEEWLASVEDPMLHVILSERFVYGRSWLQVAMTVGGGNTEDSVRKRCLRYLRSRK